jgi:hypothetical protein
MLFAPRPKSLGKDAFLKLSDKEEVTGIFRGEIHTFRRHWANNRGVECGGEGCAICQADPENYPAFRFRINFITTKDGKWLAKIFEGGGELYDTLTSLDKKFDLSKTVVEITRLGLKQNTKYNVLPRIDQPVSKEMEAKIGAVGLLPLTATDGPNEMAS